MNLRALFSGLFKRNAIEAASTGRRWAGVRPLAAPKETMAASRPLVMSRARALVSSNALAASAVQAWTSSLVGSGILCRSAHPSERVRKRLDAAWGRWSKRCDADGRMDLAGLQSAIAQRVVTDGEALVLLVVRDGQLRLRLLSSEQLADISQLALPGGNYLTNGIEFSPDGERVAYHVYPTPPGAVPNMTPVRVPASDVLHIFRADFGGQLRGFSWLAPALLAISEHGKLSDAALMQQQVSAMLTGFITTPEGDGAKIFAGERDQAGALIPSLEPGTMAVLDPQQDVKFSVPPRATPAEQVKKSVAHEIAAALGVTYESLTGDYSGVNYSSARVALIEHRRRAEALQYSFFEVQFLAPLFARFVGVEVLAGRVYAPGSLSAYTDCIIYPPKNTWVDPLKDAQAEALAISSGLMSRTQALAERGFDAEDVDAQIAADRAREQRLGLSFQAAMAQPQKQNEAAA